MKEKILVTGAAGFIGFNLCRKLINDNYEVIGIDNLNSYYDINLKKSRLNLLEFESQRNHRNFTFFEESIENQKQIYKIFKDYKPNKVVNLAAQAGVRYSLINPNAYIQSNIVGFSNILEACRKFNVKHLLFASSSSVYGGNTKLPLSENDNVDHPISLYAASKKSNELMAHAYSHLYNLPTTGLRFFTVYGPWGRPDMALFIFTKSILENKPINVFNHGDMIRDFTFIDDIVSSLLQIIKKKPKGDLNFDKNDPNPSSSWAPYKIFNIGNSNPVKLLEYISEIEICLDKKAIINFEDMQPGDVKSTSADTSLLEKWISFKPKTSINYGIREFVKWYKEYYEI
tara:strand:- start:1084 stop:2112 length:1029 start_codon:yes stop_codon:yes gene_type:complete